MRVLICEDEPLLRDLIASHLVMNGFVVDEAQDGADCIRQVEKQSPDIILLDLNMPTMGGIAVLRTLRDLAAEVPVMIITASTDREKLDEAKELGVCGILSKPFPISMISAELKKFLT